MKIDLTGMITAEDKAAAALRDEQERINREARAYLDSTDWYVTRNLEAGTPIPQDVVEKRQEARDAVIDIDWE